MAETENSHVTMIVFFWKIMEKCKNYYKNIHFS